LTAASIWRPVEANGPVIGRISPIFTASCAQASVPLKESANAAAPALKIVRRFISFPPFTFVGLSS
jgi:hypothetical protein